MVLLLAIGLIASLPRAADGVEAHEVVVSLAVDASNVEIQYEAIRLLTSLQLNGGTLSTSRTAVCISYDGEDETTINPQLLASLQPFNLSSIRYSKRYSLPDFSPSLNKLCALDPPGVHDDDYLLYLDADIFVVSDPLVPLTRWVHQADVVCGRPWNTFHGLGSEDFFEFVQVPTVFDDGQYPQLEAYAGGITMYGMCNTGVYFMPALVAQAMVAAARVYLVRAANTPRFSGMDVYSPSSFGIDSVILWAAQYSLNYTVAIAPTTLNFMAPTEHFMPKFLQRDREQALATVAKTGAPAGGGADVDSLLKEVEVPILAHFSQGSELYIFYKEHEDDETPPPPSSTASEAVLNDAGVAAVGGTATLAASAAAPNAAGTVEMNPSGDAMPATYASFDPATHTCVVIMRGHLRDEWGSSRLLPVVYSLINNVTACEVYADALVPYGGAMKLTSV